MGTDIHCQVEIVEDSFVFTFAEVNGIERSYELFHLMAGVRGSRTGLVPIVSCPRGLPEDSVADFPEAEGEAVHSHSWLSVAECREVLDAYQSTGYRHPTFEAVLLMMESLSPFYSEVRLVFFFDS